MNVMSVCVNLSKAFVRVLQQLQLGLLSADDYDDWLLNPNLTQSDVNLSARYEQVRVLGRKMLTCLKYFHSGDRSIVGPVIHLAMNFRSPYIANILFMYVCMEVCIYVFMYEV